MNPSQSGNPDENYKPHNRLNNAKSSDGSGLNSPNGIDPETIDCLFQDFSSLPELTNVPLPVLIDDTFHDKFASLYQPKTAVLTHDERESIRAFHEHLLILAETTCTIGSKRPVVRMSQPLELNSGEIIVLIEISNSSGDIFMVPDLDYLSGKYDQPYEPDVFEGHTVRLLHHIDRAEDGNGPLEHCINVLYDCSTAAITSLENLYDSIGNDPEADFTEFDEEHDTEPPVTACGTYSYTRHLLDEALALKLNVQYGYEPEDLPFLESEESYRLFDITWSAGTDYIGVTAMVALPPEIDSVATEPHLHAVSFELHLDELGRLFMEEVESEELGPVRNFYPEEDGF